MTTWRISSGTRHILLTGLGLVLALAGILMFVAFNIFKDVVPYEYYGSDLTSQLVEWQYGLVDIETIPEPFKAEITEGTLRISAPNDEVLVYDMATGDFSITISNKWSRTVVALSVGSALVVSLIVVVILLSFSRVRAFIAYHL